MIVKNKNTVADRAFWAHCEAVAREVKSWPGWMRGEAREVEREAAIKPAINRASVYEQCATIALEQRCERGTPWDMACVAVAKAIREAPGARGN
jgi:hypothetical protein